MKHNLKRLTALILALSMTLSLLSATAWAAETDEDDTVTTGDTDLELEGTDDVGDLIVGALSETEEEQTAEENYICDVEVDGTTATVTYNISEASVDADVVVAIYDEDTQQMLASGTTTVSSDDSSCTVTIEGTMPTYFLVTAYLLEADTHQPLSSEYTSQLYTQEMQEFLAKTTDDFEEEQVLNLDDDTTTNFLVYSEGTVVVDESSSAATVTDNGDGTYTVTNADATFTGLRAGDALSYAYEDGTVLIVKVKSVSVNGTTVTITEDEDADLSDVFDYVKIEADSENCTPTVDTSVASDGVTYLGDTVSASAIDKETSYSQSAQWSVTWSSKGDENDNSAGEVSINGTVTVGYTLNVKLYIAASYQYVSVQLDCSLGGTVTLKGKADLVDYTLAKIDIPLVTGVSAVLKLTFQVEYSASITFTFTVKSTIGAYYDSNQDKISSQCSGPSASYETKFEGTLYVGLKLENYITAVDEKLSKVGLSGKAGVEINMKAGGNSSSSDSEVHTCLSCYAGTVTGKCSFSANVDLLNGKITVTADIWSYSDKLFDFYYSVDHDEWGFSTCPYISYLCTITVKNYSGDPVSGATVTCSGLEESLETDENGVVSFYLPNGTYSLTASSGTQQKKTSFTVYNNKKVLTVTVVNTQIDFDTEDPGTGDDDEDGDGSGSGDSSGSGGSSATEVASGTCGDDLTWVLDEDYVLTISGTGKMTGWSSVSSVPWYSYQTSIVSVKIKDGVTSIGSYAFRGCTGLTSVIISDSVTTIGSYAFYFCTGLTSVIIPDSVTSIGSYAFHGCTSLTSVYYQGTLEDWLQISLSGSSSNPCYGGASLYIDGELLTEAEIPDGVTSISSAAFYGCTSLTSVTIPDSVTSIRSSAFDDCTSLTSVTIPDSVTSIGSNAFYGCTSLTSVTIGSGVTTIGSYAFYGCTSLTSVTIGSSVTSIGSYAFYKCTNLTNAAIPDAVTSIGSSAFYGCTGLTSVIIPDSVTSIGEDAFYGCTSLTSVTIGSSVTSIGSYAFYKCTNLTNAAIPDAVTSIGKYAFYNCTSLTSLNIPDGVTSIGEYAFYNCTSLASSVTIPDGITSIGEGTFYNCTELAKVDIGSSVTSIGSYAFCNCTSLTSVTIGSSVTSIGSYAFYKCTNLTNAAIPDAVTSIGVRAFYKCTSLTDVTIGGGVTSVGLYVFGSCTNLTNVNISDGVTSIGECMFSDCTSLTSVSIPDGVTSIGDLTFYNCTSLISVDIPDSVNSIGECAFKNCSVLTSVKIPDGVTSIESQTFYCCYKLTDITIPDSVISIGSYAFHWCQALTSITIPNSVTSIGNYAFQDCHSLTTITISNSVTSIGNSAFDDVNHLADVYYTGSEDDWAAITIGSNNTCLTSATIHYNYTVSASSVDESSESVTAAEAEPETEPEPESETKAENEAEPEAEPEPETGDESEPEVTETTAAGGDLSLDYLLSGAGTVVPLMAYTGETTSTDNTQTAVFTGLVSGEAYVLLVVKDAEAESLLAADNLLYIAQASADDSGSVTFTYIPRETVDTAVSYAYGTSSQNLADAEITLEAESFGYTGGAIKPLATVVYNGVTLEEDVDYTMSYSNNTKIGTASVTIKGRGDYAGTVKKTFTIIKGTQSVTASVSASSIVVGKTAQITAAAQGTLSYESSDTAVAAVDENGIVTAVGAGTAVITVTAAETDNFESGSTTLTVKVLLTTPTLSSVSNTVSGVKITWKAVSGAAKYRVFRKTGSGSWAKVADTTSTSYTDTSAVSGTTYKYTVRCINSACTSYTSSYDTAGLAITRLSAPSLSSASNASSGITVKWAQVKGAQGYRIYRKAGSAANWTKVKTVSGGSTVSWTDTDVTNGTKYTYTVRAYSKASGSTDWSTYNTTGKTNYRLTRPTISSLKNVKTKKMTVKWGKNSKATGYQIYISTSSDFSSNTRSLTVSSYKTVSKTISGLTKGKKYYVRVRAYKTVSGTKYYSAWSSTKNVKISK